MREQTLKRLPTTIFGNMKRLGYILGGIAIGAILFIGSSAHAQVANSYWKLLGGTILPNIDSWTLTLPFLGSSGSPCVDVTSTTGLLGTTTCGGGGSGTVTSITAGTGLTGGTITTSGTIALSVPVSIANGGTGTTSAVTNGVYYYNGSNAEADNNLTFTSSTLRSVSGMSALGIIAGGTGVVPNGNGFATFLNQTNQILLQRNNTSGQSVVCFTTSTSQASTASSCQEAIAGNRTNLPASGDGELDFSTRANGTIAQTAVLTATGSFGVSTTSPSALLSVAGSAGGATPLFMVSSSTSGFATTTNFEIDSQGNVLADANGNTIQLGATNATTSAQALTLSSNVSGSGIALYDTADQSTNYARLQINDVSNQYEIGSYAGSGAPSIRAIQIGVSATLGGTTLGRYLLIGGNGSTGRFSFTDSTGANIPIVGINGSQSSSNGVQGSLNLQQSFNQSGTASYYGLKIDPTETSLGSGSHYLIESGTSTAPDLFDVTNAGIASSTGLNITGNEALTGSLTLSAQGTGCATFTSGVLSSTGIACGSGSGGTGLSTTSPLSDSNLLVYSAAGAGSAYGAATTSPTFGLGLTKGGTWTVLGSAPTLALATSSLFTGATNQVPYFTDTNTLGASSNLTFNGNNLVVTGNASTTELGSTGYTYLATGASAQVGIGTSTPSVKLDVNGTLRVYGSHPQLDLISSADVYNGVAGAAYVQTTNSYPLFLGVNNTNIIEVATTTNVGIGVINPKYKLDVNGTIGNSGAAYLSFGQNTYYNTNGIYLNSNGADYGAIQQITGTDGNGTWQLGYASVVGTPSPTLTWTGNGKVGIGLTNPAFTLDVKGIAGATSPFNVASSTGTSELVVVNSGNVGVSSSTPGSLLSIGTTNGINFSTGTSTFSSTGGIQLNGGCFALSNGTCIGGSGTVTSISGSGGSTGLTLTGGPITTSGTLTLGGTLGIANGGTGSTTLSGILLGNGTSAINTLSLGGDLSLSGTTLSGTNASTTQILITSSGTFTLPAGYTQFCVTAVAGGGGGGNSALNAGGGGGGAATTCFSTTTPITVSIGAGGTAGNSGGTTNVGGVAVASGGGPGGSAAGTSNTKATGGGGGCGTTGDALFCGDGGGEAVGLAVVGAVNGSGGGAPFFAGGGQAGAGAQSCGGGGGGGGAGFAGCALLSYKQ